MGPSRPQFTIGRLMVVVAVAAVPCWLARDATVGPIVWAFLARAVGLAIVQLGALAASLVLLTLGVLATFWAACGFFAWLIDRFPARDDYPPRLTAPSSPDRTSP